MKKKNHRRKALTAVGAVVAAGLTPGIIAATPGCLPGQGSSAGISAADVVAIDGNAYGFDELYAMQQLGNGRSDGAVTRVNPQVVTKYGTPRPPGQQSTYYGVPRPHPAPRPAPSPEEIKNKKIKIALDTIQLSLMEYCVQLIDADYEGILISPDSDLTTDLGMTSEELKELQAEIKRRYDIELSYHRFYLKGQLNTLRLITEYIVKLKTVWD